MWSPSRAAALRAAKRRSAVYADINPMPYLGLCLALLVFMMIATPVPVHGVGVNLPKAQNATPQRLAVREDAIRVTVTRDGRFFFRNREALPGQLPGLIEEAVREGAEKKIYLVADSRSKYFDVGIAVDEIQLAGIRDAVILADKPKAP
jgi:biopolymer transport protein ExbD